MTHRPNRYRLPAPLKSCLKSQNRLSAPETEMNSSISMISSWIKGELTSLSLLWRLARICLASSVRPCAYSLVHSQRRFSLWYHSTHHRGDSGRKSTQAMLMTAGAHWIRMGARHAQFEEALPKGIATPEARI